MNDKEVKFGIGEKVKYMGEICKVERRDHHFVGGDLFQVSYSLICVDDGRGFRNVPQEDISKEVKNDE